MEYRTKKDVLFPLHHIGSALHGNIFFYSNRSFPTLELVWGVWKDLQIWLSIGMAPTPSPTASPSNLRERHERCCIISYALERSCKKLYALIGKKKLLSSFARNHVFYRHGSTFFTSPYLHLTQGYLSNCFPIWSRWDFEEAESVWNDTRKWLLLLFTISFLIFAQKRFHWVIWWNAMLFRSEAFIRLIAKHIFLFRKNKPIK